MASFSNIGVMLGLKKPKMPRVDASSILTSAPTDTATSNLDIARKRTAARLRSDVALTKPRATILTGAAGVGGGAATPQPKATIGGSY